MVVRGGCFELRDLAETETLLWRQHRTAPIPSPVATHRHVLCVILCEVAVCLSHASVWVLGRKALSLYTDIPLYTAWEGHWIGWACVHACMCN